MTHTLELLTKIAYGISTHFGTNCEIVIHDLRHEPIDNSVVYIENGHVSDRQVGDGPSVVVLETLETIKRTGIVPTDELAYLTKTDTGRILKSSTIYIPNKDNKKVHYIFSLNYDITDLLGVSNTLLSFIDTPKDDKQNPKPITHDVSALLDTLIEQSVEKIGKPAPLMNKEEKIAAIQFLNDHGAFLITKSGDRISSYFGISKFTLYNYLELSKQQDQ